MAKFKVGDTVRLKSGGPLMTVYDYDSDNVLTCQWFEKNQQQGGSFKEEMLELDE